MTLGTATLFHTSLRTSYLHALILATHPGKAPKLKPWRYKADFVFDRITNGFQKMPAWKDVYTKEERMALVAYILSDDFSP